MHRSAASYAPQLRAQRFARACEPRFDGPDGDAQRERDLFVAQTVDLAKDDGRPLIEWQAVERRLEPLAQFTLPKDTVGARGDLLGGQLTVVALVILNRDLQRAPAAMPPSQPVLGLVDRDAIDPRPQRGLAAEAGKCAEHAQEYLLGEVKRFLGVPEEIQRQLVDQPVVLIDQLGAGILVTCRTAGDQGSFTAADLRPGQG